MAGQWLVPFKGRNHSHVVNLNFLWREGNVCIMDNHRAAMWCWLEHLHGDTSLSLLHVDRHYDALFSEIDYAHYRKLDLSGMSVDEYLNAGYDSDFFTIIPLFRWDNYLGLFMKAFGDRIDQWAFATHGRGQRPELAPITEYLPWDFPDRSVCRDGEWLLNVDLDYFFCKTADGSREYLFSEACMRDFFLWIREMLDSGRARCLTMSLSPECCGGWEPAEQACALACSCLGLDFRLA